MTANQSSIKKKKKGLIFSKKNKERKFKIRKLSSNTNTNTNTNNKNQLGGFSTCNNIPTVIEPGMSIGSLRIQDKVATIGKHVTTGCNNKNIHPGV